MKRILSLVVAICLMCAMATGANAAQTGSIDVTVKYQDNNVNGGNLIAVKVGYLDASSGVFRKVTNHAQIHNIDTPAAVEELHRYYSFYKLIYPFVTYEAQIQDGSARFANLEDGAYLVIQTEASPGFKELGVFLVMLPYEGTRSVQVVAKPEMDPEAPTPTEPPTDPTEPPPEPPIDPTEPSDPTDPTDPTEPSDPTQPSDPTDPSDPTEPGDPTDPTDPSDSTGSTDSSETTPPTQNTPSYDSNKLPQTGQLTWPIPWMAAVGMTLFALGWWMYFGRREDDTE